MTASLPVPSTDEKIKYYLIGSIPEEFRAWAESDVQGPWLIMRRLGAVYVGFVIAGLFMALRGDLDRGYWVGILIGAAIGAAVFPVLMGDLIRRRELARLEKRWAKK